mgnify:CR=1 FL=1
MKRAKMVGVVVVAVLLALAFAKPSDAHSQVAPTSDMAAAGLLHGQPDRWADAARLYVVAAGLRQREDPEARRDLFTAASLYHQTGDNAGAIAALESAGARALAGGDVAEARRMFARAAWVARDAGLTTHERRLKHRASDVADASPVGTRGARPTNS